MNQHDTNEFAIGLTAHDSTYSIDYEKYIYKKTCDSDLQTPETMDLEKSICCDTGIIDGSSEHATLIQFVLRKVNRYREKNHYKIVGAGITEEADILCPHLRSLLWSQLDIVSFKFKPFGDVPGDDPTSEDAFDIRVDEESDSVVRKAIMYVVVDTHKA